MSFTTKFINKKNEKKIKKKKLEETFSRKKIFWANK